MSKTSLTHWCGYLNDPNPHGHGVPVLPTSTTTEPNAVECAAACVRTVTANVRTHGLVLRFGEAEAPRHPKCAEDDQGAHDRVPRNLQCSAHCSTVLRPFACALSGLARIARSPRRATEATLDEMKAL